MLQYFDYQWGPCLWAEPRFSLARALVSTIPLMLFCFLFLHVGGSQQNGIDLPAGLSSDDFSMDGASLLVHWIQPL